MRLAPDPPRRIPGRRAMSVSMRAVHITAFGILLGGHVFDVAASRLTTALVVAIVSGGGLTAIELVATFAWVRTVAGMAIIVKVALLLAVPVLWDQRVPILLLTVLFASVVSHLPARVRHARVW